MPLGPPIVTFSIGSERVSSTQVSARSPDSLRPRPSDSMSAVTGPRKINKRPSVVGATRPNGGIGTGRLDVGDGVEGGQQGSGTSRLVRDVHHNIARPSDQTVAAPDGHSVTFQIHQGRLS